ncbi:MAG: type II toxin-antitoxin system PemK/MazF family toxin [Nevskiales bacterium]
MKRGDVVTVAFLSGDFGKPRPALVIQADLFNATHASVTVLPVTGTIADAPLFRITLDPSRQNGLKKVSQIMVDKAISVRLERVEGVIGRLNDDVMIRVNRALAVWLGIA